MEYKFRSLPSYRGEYYLTMQIPAIEDSLIVPCDATRNANAATGYTLQLKVLYSFQDLDFARELGRNIVRQHPTWEWRIERRPDPTYCYRPCA